MSPIYFLWWLIMALNKDTEQISFEDLKFEAEIEEEYKTVTGKECRYEPTYDAYKSYEIDVGEDISGYPEVTIIEKKGKSYDALRVRVIDDSAEEILDCYANFPKADKNGYVKDIKKSFDFYRNIFDFIYSVLKYRDERNVVDKNGEEYTVFKSVNLLTFAKYIDQMERITVKTTEGNPDSEYNSWIIYKME